jgi:hypothetical protein
VAVKQMAGMLGALARSSTIVLQYFGLNTLVIKDKTILSRRIKNT